MKIIALIISFLSVSLSLLGQLSPVDSLKVKYVDWLIGAQTDYATPEVVERYNRYIANGVAASDLSAYDFQNPGPVWDLTNSIDRSEYSTLVETKLIRLVYLYKLQGPVGSPNPNYNSSGLRDTILTIFQYMKDKGVGPSTNFNIYELASIEMLEIYNSVALRSSAYSASILLMKDELKLAGEFDHHMGALNTLTNFLRSDNPIFNFTNPGFNTDVIRSTVVQRFCFLIAQDDTVATRYDEMVYFKQFIDNSLKISNGWSDYIKPDFITYHHKGPYTNSYGINALQTLSILNWIFSGSSFELDQESQSNLQNGILNYSKFCIDYEMPRGTSGRFPTDLAALNSLRLAHAYMYLADTVGNEDMASEFVRLWDISSTQNTNLIRSATLSIVTLHGLQGPRHFMETIQSGLPPAPKKEGHFGFPYAGLSVHKRQDFQLNFKGSSKYIWDYENSASENVFGRYMSAGGMDILSGGTPVSYDSSGLRLVGWDWAHFPGTTTTYLPFNQLGPATHRLFSDRNFIGNASLDDNGTFALDYTDNYSPTDMSALKSYFSVGNKVLCLGSAIQDTNGTNPVHTTLFQTELFHPDSVTYINGTAQTGLSTNYSQAGGALWITDAMGNGYVVPANSFNTDEIAVKREVQNSMNHSNTTATSGNFATAWINHGTAPQDADYYYIVVVNGGSVETPSVAQNPGSYFEVFQLNQKAHGALYVPDSIISYTVFDTSAVFLNDYVRQVDRPAVVLTQAIDNQEKLKISVTNPDLGMLNTSEFYQYNQIGSNADVYYRIPQLETVTVTLSGEWELDQPAPGQTITYDGIYSYLQLETINGITVQTLLKQIFPSNVTVHETDTQRLQVYPNPTQGLVYLDLKPDEMLNWFVYDSRGNKLNENITLVQDVDRLVLDFESLSQGMYLLIINEQVYRISR